MKSVVRKWVKSLRQVAAAEDFGWRGAVALALDYRAAARRRSEIPVTAEQQVSAAVDALRTQGFYALEGFFSVQQCDTWRRELEQAAQEHPEFIHSATPYDKRIHGIENLVEDVALFTRNPVLSKIAETFLQEPVDVAFTLGAILEAVPNNPGSGGGWHRDNFTRQFKTMVYLKDVNVVEDGAFQLLSHSHHLSTSIRDNRIMHQQYGNARMSHESVMELLRQTGMGRLHTLTAKAGTVLMFDSSTIHRGAPLLQGTRYALTNYFYPVTDIAEELYAHFHPVAGHTKT